MKAFITRASKIVWLYTFIFVLTFQFNCILDPDSNGNGVNNTNFAASEEFSYSFEAENFDQIELHAVNGSIELVGIPSFDSVRIAGERKVESESIEDAELQLQELKVLVTLINDKILIETNQPQQSMGRNYTVNYQVQIPAAWRVAVSQANGNISVSSVLNAVEILQSNGDIFVESVVGEIDAILTNGNINLSEITGNTKVGLTNGNIYGEITLDESGTCEMTTVNGNIQLSIPKETSAKFSGNVTNGQILMSNLTLKNTISTTNSLSGILGSGSGMIELRTVNGNIIVSGS